MLRQLSFLAAAAVTSTLGLALEPDTEKRASIWSLSDDDSTVYLAGSVHLLREEDLPLPGAFDEVYEKADELVFEIDMGTMFEPSMALKLREMGALPAGETLSRRVSADTMTAIRDYLKSRNLPERLFDGFKPGMVYLTISSLEATRQGARPDLGLEAQYYRKSVADNKPSRGLETPEFQISRFDHFDDKTIEELILQSLEDIEESPESLDEIISAWKSGNAETLAELIGEHSASSPRMREVLLTERNENWIPLIEEALAGSKNVMFLVGAAHLVGEGSVVELLEKKGYELSQIENGE